MNVKNKKGMLNETLLKKLKSLSSFSKYFITGVYIILILLVLFISVEKQTFSLIFSLLLVPLIIWLLKDFQPNMFNKKKKTIIFLILLCIFIKTFFVCLFDLNLIADYKTYFDFATELSNHYHISYNTLYIALFNHVYGYASILGLIFSVSGSSIPIALGFNIFLSTVSMFYIYKISDRVVNEKMAFISSIIWIFFPSQILWNSFVLSEPLYVTLLLIFYYLCLINKNNKIKGIILLVISAITLSLFNMVRPIGIIVVIALIIWQIILKIETVNLKRIFQIIFIILLYLGINKLIIFNIQDRMDIKLGGFSWYNVNVGLNEDSGGMWNKEDWNRVLTNVNKYEQLDVSNPAQQTQQIEKEIALDKIKNVEKPFKLIKSKLYTFLGSDDGVVEHMLNSNVTARGNNFKYLKKFVNIYYFVIMVLSIIGVIKCIKNKFFNKTTDLLFIVLYAIGLTMGHIIMEVQPRYHYSIILCFIFLASFALSDLKNERSD